MIKTEDNITKLSCDSCHIKIASCENFNFEDNQELVLSPLLCESCGQKHNKSIGDNIKKIEYLNKEIERIIKEYDIPFALSEIHGKKPIARKECKLKKDML